MSIQGLWESESMAPIVRFMNGAEAAAVVWNGQKEDHDDLVMSIWDEWPQLWMALHSVGRAFDDYLGVDYPEPKTDPRTVSCSYCGVRIDERCVSISGAKSKSFHAPRVLLADRGW